MDHHSFIAGIRKGGVIILIAFLALVPFLHGHLGASHVKGFHVDGLDLSHNAKGAEAQGVVSIHDASEEESPALGVSVSLPQTSDDVHLATVLIGFLLWTWLAKKALATRLQPPPEPAQAAPRTYPPGWPPPALAPPL